MDGNLDEARALFSQAVELYSKYFGPKYIRTLDATFNLGGINYLQKKPDKAMEYFEKAKQGYQEIYDHKSGFKTVYYIGKVFELQGIVPRAKLSYRQALQAFEGLDYKDEDVAQSILDTTSALRAVYQQPEKDVLRGQKRRVTPEETPEKRIRVTERHDEQIEVPTTSSESFLPTIREEVDNQVST